MRVKSGIVTHRRHKKVRKATKGMIKTRRASYRLGKQAIIRSLQNAYRDRRTRKRAFRQLWIIRLNAAVREHDLSYSEFINKLQKTKIDLNRKSLSELAIANPKAFTEIIKIVKNVK